MELTRRQEEGLRTTIERYKQHEHYTVISGYAGSGKTTLVKFIIEALQLPPERVVFCAYTGKAVQVLQSHGNKNACTLHKLLYEARPLPDGKFYFIPKTRLDYDMVIVDECSMMPKSMMQMLLKHKNIYILFTGDPGQLPPINKDEDNHLLDHPHVFLDEIMRQAQESDIIRLSMKIRNGEELSLGTSNDAIVMNKSDLNSGVLTWADQILCATNAVRINLNQQMRQLNGHGPEPEDGDKVICLRNYEECASDDGNMLVNGITGYISNVYQTFTHPPRFIYDEPIDILKAEFITDNGDSYGELSMDRQEIMTGKRFADGRTLYKLSKNKIAKTMIPMEFTYGYAITVHKAQGSQWDKVLVIEENFPFAKEEHQRWLYTAVTRAVEKLVLVKKR